MRGEPGSSGLFSFVILRKLFRSCNVTRPEKWLRELKRFMPCCSLMSKACFMYDRKLFMSRMLEKPWMLRLSDMESFWVDRAEVMCCFIWESVNSVVPV